VDALTRRVADAHAAGLECISVSRRPPRAPRW